MKHTEKEAMEIAQQYKNQYPDLSNKIVRAQYNQQFDVIGLKAWIITGEFELFGETREFYYVISDATGEVEYTFDEYGTRDPHLDNR